MTYFHPKEFNGSIYTFEHLNPLALTVQLDAAGTKQLDLTVTFSTHCFTEKFDEILHHDHHRYTFRGERRAFDVRRYECSLQLPHIMPKLLKGGCPEFCVNGASVNVSASSPQTGW